MALEENICILCNSVFGDDNPGILVGKKGADTLLDASRNELKLQILIKTKKEAHQCNKIPILRGWSKFMG